MADETTLAETPAETTVADPTTKIEAPADVAAETEQKPAAETTEVKPEGETEQGDDKKRREPGSQRLKRRLALIENDYLSQQGELETLRREKAEREQREQNPQGRPGIDREPKESDYPNDWFAFQEAKGTWNARQAVREEFARKSDEERRSAGSRAQQERRAELLDAYHENAAEVRERIPDFDKVIATAASVQIKPDLADEIMSSDKSALLQYHLAQKPDLVRQLNQLSVRELAREIGRLEARVHLPQPKKATEANPPPTEVRGGAAPAIDARTGPDDMNAYVAWRRKQGA